jgi:hypothetical protein
MDNGPRENRLAFQRKQVMAQLSQLLGLGFLSWEISDFGKQCRL